MLSIFFPLLSLNCVHYFFILAILFIFVFQAKETYSVSAAWNAPLQVHRWINDFQQIFISKKRKEEGLKCLFSIVLILRDEKKYRTWKQIMIMATNWIHNLKILSVCFLRRINVQLGWNHYYFKYLWKNHSHAWTKIQKHCTSFKWLHPWLS